MGFHLRWEGFILLYDVNFDKKIWSGHNYEQGKWIELGIDIGVDHLVQKTESLM